MAEDIESINSENEIEGVEGDPTVQGEDLFAQLVDEEENQGAAIEDKISVDGSELDAFESADIEVVEFIEEERLDSIVESLLFATDRPIGLGQLKVIFKGTNVKTDMIRKSLGRIAVEMAGARRGVTLEEVPGGYQLRTKVDNLNYLTRNLKARPFKLSGPALETLSIVAYKQPIVKAEVDEIRGVESGHLLRALMEKGLINFEGKSDLPGKPMQYGTTRKFLEIFGLRNLKELPTLSQIDEILPEGIDEVGAQKGTLSSLTSELSQTIGSSYSEGEDELGKITDQLTEISTSSEFFEQEKERERKRKEAEKAEGIREALMMGEEVTTRDRNWLMAFDLRQAQQSSDVPPVQVIRSDSRLEGVNESVGEESHPVDAEFQADTLDFEEEDNVVDQDLATPFHDEEEDEDGSSGLAKK